MEQDTFKIRLKCPESQELIYAKEDFSLRWHQRLALKGHLMICGACTNTQKNVALLREQLLRWRGADH